MLRRLELVELSPWLHGELRLVLDKARKALPA